MVTIKDYVVDRVNAFLTHHASSNVGKRFGLPSFEGDLRSKAKAAAETALRFAHWVPGLSLAAGTFTLGRVAVNFHLSNRSDLEEEEWADVARGIMAIVNVTLLFVPVLVLLDVGTTYYRAKAEESFKQLQPNPVQLTRSEQRVYDALQRV